MLNIDREKETVPIHFLHFLCINLRQLLRYAQEKYYFLQCELCTNAFRCVQKWIFWSSNVVKREEQDDYQPKRTEQRFQRWLSAFQVSFRFSGRNANQQRGRREIIVRIESGFSRRKNGLCVFV